MTDAELTQAQALSTDIAKTSSILSIFPAEKPNPVDTEEIKKIVDKLNTDIAGASADLITAVDAECDAFYDALKTALETHKTSKVNEFGNFVGTDTVPE